MDNSKADSKNTSVRRRPDSGNVKSEVSPEEVEVKTESPKESEPAKTKVKDDSEGMDLKGPFVVAGMAIKDKSGRQICLCGRPGEMSRTGPEIAAAMCKMLNS